MEKELIIETDIIHAKTRKLKATWTMECEQDIKNIHGLDETLAQNIKNIHGLDETLAQNLPKEITESSRPKLKIKKYRSLDDEWSTD